MNSATPKKCRQCQYLWTHGVKDGKHDRWCCHWGRPAPRAFSHCELKGGFKLKEIK